MMMTMSIMKVSIMMSIGLAVAVVISWIIVSHVSYAHQMSWSACHDSSDFRDVDTVVSTSDSYVQTSSEYRDHARRSRSQERRSR